MTQDQQEYAEAARKRSAESRSADGRRVARLVWWILVTAVVIATVGGVGFVTGRDSAPTADSSGGSSSSSSPGDTSAEAGFARDMQVHHAQAVEMSFIIRDTTQDPTIRAIAYDIITSQQQQIGQMYAWLDSWGLPQTSSQPPMAWMSDMDHTGMSDMPGMGKDPNSPQAMQLLPDGRMPGMASPEAMARLRSATGQAAERLWLGLMITHHRAGVMMADAVIQASEDRQVVTLASAIRTAQLAEIEQMRTLLDRRG